MRSIFKTPFEWIVIACGFLSLIVLSGNLTVLGLHRHPDKPRLYVHQGDDKRGRKLVQSYGCGGCHVIPGVANATGRVGPRLDAMSGQIYIAGVLANTPENMVRWIRAPQEINSRTAMPNLGVTDQDARDIAAYLYARSSAN